MSKEKTKTTNPKKCTTPKFRVSFPSVFTPKKGNEDDDESKAKYGLTMLFPKEVSLKALKRAHDAALQEGIEKLWKGKQPKNLMSPFRDGDEEDDYADKDGFADHIFVRASSKQKPGLIDQKKNKITDPEEFYAGCYARATLVAYAYDQKGNKGVAFGLQNIQKMAEGKPFSGRMKAEDEFDEIEDDEDDDFDD